MKKKKCKGVLGLLAAGLLGLWPTAGLRAQGVVTMADAETSAETVKCDTIRMTWEAKAGEEKGFSLTSVKGGQFVVHWGDGDSAFILSRGSHIYAQSGSYNVLICGKPYERFVSPPETDYTEYGIEMRMVYVQGGTFLMGTRGASTLSDEYPVHSVTLDDFYIGQFEVTQAQWKAVMGTNPCSSFYDLDDDYPVYQVSWNDAFTFCKKLSEATGKTYRLPTEAEWEYAARGGQYNDGTKYAGSDTIDEVAWYNSDGSYVYDAIGIHPVGQKRPNGLGLYDMSGNVYEWCSDRYDKDYYGKSPAVNPKGSSSGSCRVYRGGGWIHSVGYCRVSKRDYGRPEFQTDFLGFRVVCVP